MNKKRLENIRPLNFTSKAYMDAHLNFRNKITNQGKLMVEFLQNYGSDYIKKHDEERYKIASVGAGTGMIDAPFVEYLQRVSPITYQAIEPNPHENKIAKAKMEQVMGPESEAHFFTGVLQEFELSNTGDVFDLIIAVHVLYYTSDVATMLRQMLNMLHRERGVLITIVASNMPVAKLFTETSDALFGYKPILSDEFKALLDQQGVSYKTHMIEAQINIADIIDELGVPQNKQFFDFFIHADSASLPPEVKKEYIDIIRSEVIEQHGTLILPHIAEAVMVGDI